MTGMPRVPRSRGALNGVRLVLLGIWGGLIAFVGPYFHYAYTPDKAFTYTAGRLWLEILPAASAVLGGLILGLTASRPGLDLLPHPGTPKNPVGRTTLVAAASAAASPAAPCAAAGR